MDKINNINRTKPATQKNLQKQILAERSWAVALCKLSNRMEKEVPEYRLYKSAESFSRPLLSESCKNFDPNISADEIRFEIRPHSKNPKFVKLEIALLNSDLSSIASGMVLSGTKKEILSFLNNKKNFEVIPEYIYNLQAALDGHKS